MQIQNGSGLYKLTTTEVRDRCRNLRHDCRVNTEKILQ